VPDGTAKLPVQGHVLPDTDPSSITRLSSISH